MFSRILFLFFESKYQTKKGIMDTIQIILLALVLLIVFFRVKKYFIKRSLKNYTSEEAKGLLKSGGIVLLDVRTDRERKSGAIKPSIHIPLHEISLKADQLKKYGEREIVCYCQTGSRSVSAAAKLRKLGFNSANLTDGYVSW